MKKMNSRVVLILAFVVVILLAACSGNNSGNSSKNSNNDSGEMDTSNFVTVSFLMLGDPPANGQDTVVLEKVNALLKEKVNAHVELKWIEWADYMTKYNLLLAAGEPIDLINVSTTWLEAWQNAQRGAFLPLDDLLPKYAPLTYGEITESEWAQATYKDEIIMIPENNYTQWVNHGVYYRGDWAKEFGINQPIRDWETLGQYLQGVKDEKGVIPWDVTGTKNEATYGYIFSHTDAVELPIPTGWFPVYWAKSYEDKYSIYSPIFEDTFIEYATLMKSWADKGYWREDVLNYTGDTRQLLRGGLTGVDQHHTQTFAGLRTSMDLDQPGSELQMFPFARTRGNLVEAPITHGATAVGDNSKNPERALMVYDLIRNDQEIYQLFNYGIEGVQYEVVDGKRTRPADYDEARDNFYSNFWGGRVDKNEIPDINVWEGVFELYQEYDAIKKPYPYGRFVFDKTPIETELAAISQVTSSTMPMIAWGKAGDPVKAVEDLRQKLKAAGYDKMLEEIQRQMDEYKKLVEG